MRTKEPRVYFVGAGPGNPGLLTLRALEVLGKVDVVLYDNLVTKEILSKIPQRVKKIYVGKRPGKKGITQDAIIQKIIFFAKHDKSVARLKGGDALFFSRGSEEAIAMNENGITFEIVPGISSVIGATAYAGVALTHRDYSSSIFVATGEEGKSHPQRINWQNLPQSGTDTIVVVMGAKKFRVIARQLLKGGMAQDTPVVAIRWGTTDKQEVSSTTLKCASSGKIRIRSPSVIVVGKILTLMSKISWVKPRNQGIDSHRLWRRMD
jgi:uroporphyrin-III C-methyltransferase